MSPRTSFPSMSVVVPVLNESTHLRGTVTQLQATLLARSEILVVDDGFTDGCADFLTRAAAGMSMLRTAHLGAARARNQGLNMLGEDHCVCRCPYCYPLSWWEPLVAALDNPCVGAVAPVISAMGQPQQKGFGLRWKGPTLEEAGLSLPL